MLSEGNVFLSQELIILHLFINASDASCYIAAETRLFEAIRDVAWLAG